ncbi:phosphatidate cytidylyltransferase [Alphaproteobacteria bacterium]|nr:phosphatidate cytidylyltransferase [Alphaproteobacteria bacterium]
MNFIVVSGDTVLSVIDANSGASLKSRIISALVLAPLVVGAVYLGSPIYDLLILTTVVIMAWEWRRLCAHESFGNPGIIFIVTVTGAAALASFGYVEMAALFVGAGALIVLSVIIRSAGKSSIWMISGILAVGVTGISLILIRRIGDDWLFTMWFLVAIWATDISAFFVGRAIGGPKLAPKISPGKTWSGLLGGIMGAVCWSMIWTLWTGTHQAGTLAVFAGFIAIFAQFGDLGVSRVKRRYGVKDTGTLIPGHGGLLDRVDGIIGAVPFAVLCNALAIGDMSLWA